MMKMALAIQHGVVPPTLHVDEPTPHVDWSGGAVALATERLPWPDTGLPRRGGVSAFGVSGTNAHLVLEEAPAAPAEERDTPAAGVLPWVLSGRTAPALLDQARRLAAHLGAAGPLDPADVGLSLATTRATLEHRAVLVGHDLDDLRRGLEAFTANGPAAAAAHAVGGGGRRRRARLPGPGLAVGRHGHRADGHRAGVHRKPARLRRRAGAAHRLVPGRRAALR
jgi:acyl transferase domain-containing protein